MKIKIPKNWIVKNTAYAAGYEFCADYRTKTIHIDRYSLLFVKSPRYLILAHEVAHARLFEKTGEHNTSRHELYARIYEGHIVWKKQCKKSAKAYRETVIDSMTNPISLNHKKASEKIMKSNLWKRINKILGIPVGVNNDLHNSIPYNKYTPEYNTTDKQV